MEEGDTVFHTLQDQSEASEGRILRRGPYEIVTKHSKGDLAGMYEVVSTKNRSDKFLARRSELFGPLDQESMDHVEKSRNIDKERRQET